MISNSRGVIIAAKHFPVADVSVEHLERAGIKNAAVAPMLPSGHAHMKSTSCRASNNPCEALNMAESSPVVPSAKH
jgi:hypothetical protein